MTNATLLSKHIIHHLFQESLQPIIATKRININLTLGKSQFNEEVLWRNQIATSLSLFFPSSLPKQKKVKKTSKWHQNDVKWHFWQLLWDNFDVIMMSFGRYYDFLFCLRIFFSTLRFLLLTYLSPHLYCQARDEFVFLGRSRLASIRYLQTFDPHAVFSSLSIARNESAGGDETQVRSARIKRYQFNHLQTVHGSKPGRRHRRWKHVPPMIEQTESWRKFVTWTFRSVAVR